MAWSRFVYRKRADELIRHTPDANRERSVAADVSLSRHKPENSMRTVAVKIWTKLWCEKYVVTDVCDISQAKEAPDADEGGFDAGAES